MLQVCLHSIRALAVTAVVVATLTGCRAWNAERWDLTRLRDDRASEIDARLSSRPPLVNNPFQTPTE